MEKKSQSDEGDSRNFTLLSDPKRKVLNETKPISAPQQSSKLLQHRVPPLQSISDVITPKKFLFQMDLISPCKDEESMVTTTKVKTPRQKRRASDSHTGLTPGISELLPCKAKRLRASLDLSSKSDKESEGRLLTALSPIKSLINVGDDDGEDVEMNPSHVFANSPGSPAAAQCQAMLEDIHVVSPASDQGGEGFLKRQSKFNMRRCRSLELRKKLLDMTNTPPSGFKKSLFKKPAPISDVKSSLAKESKFEYPSPSSECYPEETTKISNELVETADHQRIKKAVDVLHDQDLIADGSRRYCLPLVQGKHTDLQNIDQETMAMLVSKTYPNVFDKMTIIDCRYPYEYEGGHIRGALNIYTEERMNEFLEREVEESKTASQTHILVFHCEFSSHRAPTLLRHLRNCDRQMNLHQYPKLQFPEIYCLFGGYKDFYSNHPELCEPSAYTPMVDEKYASDLRHFRAKAKSWAAGDRLKLKQQQHL